MATNLFCSQVKMFYYYSARSDHWKLERLVSKGVQPSCLINSTRCKCDFLVDNRQLAYDVLHNHLSSWSIAGTLNTNNIINFQMKI